MEVHRHLGPDLLEPVCDAALAYELGQRGLALQRQVPVPIEHRGLNFQEGYRLDLWVEHSVTVELKWLDAPCEFQGTSA